MISYAQLSAARNPVALKGPSVFSLDSRYALSSGYWLDSPNIDDCSCHRVSASVMLHVETYNFAAVLTGASPTAKPLLMEYKTLVTLGVKPPRAAPLKFIC